MIKLEQIERAIAALTREEQAKLEAWWARFCDEQWDRQVADDHDAGRLDDLIAEARAEIAARARRPIDREKVKAIIERSARRPVLDPRPADEILDYDEFGIPR